MMIPCPQCKTLIETPDASAGDAQLVSCPYCRNRFDPRFAAAHQRESMIGRLYREEKRQAELREQSPAPEPDPAPEPAPEPVLEPEPAPAPAGIQVAPEDIPLHVRKFPAGAMPGEPPAPERHPLASFSWAMASLLLLLALGAQYAYVTRDDLARQVELRPVLEWICAYTGCALPLMHSPEMVRITGRDIRRHPEISDALIVSISLANQAPYKQAFPVLELKFFDLRSRPLAMRRFTPDEYLPANIDARDGMPRNTPVQVTLEIVDPGTDAVNFTFTLM